MGQALIRAAVVVALLAGTVRAQPASRAKDLFAQGMRHYDLAEYDAAIAAFREAYQLAPAPGLLFNLAQAYRLKGPDGCALAVRFYKNYLLAAPAAKNRAFVEETVRSLEPCASPLADAPPTTQPAAPQPEPTRQPEPTPQPEPVFSPPPPPPSSPPVDWRPYAVLGAGALFTGVGAYLYLDAGSTYAELEDTCASHTCPRSTWESARTRERVGIGLTIGGLATAAAGTFWLLTTRRGDDATTVVPTTTGAAVRMTF